jgi:selenide,water dikinase
MCGGCGAKVGLPSLKRALHVSGSEAVGDDAGLLRTGNATQVISTDHLRAMTLDPVSLTRIAAVHALGDIWAMGASPQAAVSSVILPRQSSVLAARQLEEISQTAQDVFAAAGADIVGGHSTLGAEMTIGFTVTGLCEAEPITLKGAKAGDVLILTKPIGSGVLMAAEMDARADGADVQAALRLMMQPQGKAAKILSGANAMTDVTGFGLAGHAMNMAEASAVGMEVWLDAVPLMQGAMDLSRQGIRSSLYDENRDPFTDVPEGTREALLFDPQTAGGLLAAVSGNGTTLIEQLQAEGFDAAIIGQVTDRPCQFVVA